MDNTMQLEASNCWITWNIGPLWDWGPQSLYSNTVNLVNLTKSCALSDLAPNLQDSLSVTLDLPIA